MAPGQEENALAATSPGQLLVGVLDGLGSGISASKFITIPGNAGPKSTLIPHPLERSSDDSDEDDTGGPASSMNHEVVSRRNCSMMNKHKLKIQRSTGPEGTGNGLFTAATLEAKTVLPIKGMWFETLDKLNDWLASLSGTSAQQFAQRVIKVNFSQGSDVDTKVARYFAMTSPHRVREFLLWHQPEGECENLVRPWPPLGPVVFKAPVATELG